MKAKRKAPPKAELNIKGRAIGEALAERSAQFWEKLLSLLRFNIAFKLSLGYALHMLWLMVLVFVVLNLGFLAYLRFDTAQLLEQQLASASERFRSSGFETEKERLALRTWLKTEGAGMSWYSLEGQRLSPPDDLAPKLEDLPSDWEQQEPWTIDRAFDKLFELWQRYGTGDQLYGATTLQMPDGSGLQLIISRSLPPWEERQLPFVWISGSFLTFLWLSSLGAMSRMTHRHLRPIHAMTSQVQEISSHNLSTRLNVSGTKDELKDLAVTFNRMLEDIQGSYEREKQFVSDASHELRTPISVIKGYADLLSRWGKQEPEVLDEGLEAILSETAYMQQLVESLLYMARNEKSGPVNAFEEVLLSAFLTEIERDTRLIDPDHLYIFELEPEVRLKGSPEKLKQLVRILLDNSKKYTPSGRTIRLTLKQSVQTVYIVVADEGMGISKEDLPRIFERFYRADKARTRQEGERSGGIGLGLSIATLLAAQHGGKIYAESQLGQGTTMTVALPKA